MSLVADVQRNAPFIGIMVMVAITALAFMIGLVALLAQTHG